MERLKINFPLCQSCANMKSLFEVSNISVTSGPNCWVIRSHMEVVTAHGPIKLTCILSIKATEATESLE